MTHRTRRLLGLIGLALSFSLVAAACGGGGDDDDSSDTQGPAEKDDATPQPGGTLTFRGEPFVWEVLDAPAGEFIVGFIVEDLDGNATQSFARVNVE